MSETPMTDEETFNGTLFAADENKHANMIGEFTNASLARRLERERAELIEELREVEKSAYLNPDMWLSKVSALLQRLGKE